MYFSAVEVTGRTAPAPKKHVAGILVFGAGVAIGLGVATVLAAAFARRSSRSRAG